MNDDHSRREDSRSPGRTALAERLRVMPAVVVTGVRQTGKSTLAEHLVPGARRFASLDDLDVLDSARRDPEVLVGGTGPVTLDEIQREPGLRQVSESLAGRASYLTLWPMTRREQRGLGRGGV